MFEKIWFSQKKIVLLHQQLKKKQKFFNFF